MMIFLEARIQAGDIKSFPVMHVTGKRRVRIIEAAPASTRAYISSDAS
jgi:hypothetical protein